MKKCTLY